MDRIKDIGLIILIISSLLIMSLIGSNANKFKKFKFKKKNISNYLALFYVYLNKDLLHMKFAIILSLYYIIFCYTKFD